MLRGRHGRDPGFQPKLALKMGQKAVHERLEATPQWIAEAGVGTHWLSHRRERALDHFFEVGERHPAAKPGGLHIREWYRPELPVVGNREMLGNAGAPDLVNELLEIPGRTLVQRRQSSFGTSVRTGLGPAVRLHQRLEHATSVGTRIIAVASVVFGRLLRLEAPEACLDGAYDAFLDHVRR